MVVCRCRLRRQAGSAQVPLGKSMFLQEIAQVHLVQLVCTLQSSVHFFAQIARCCHFVNHRCKLSPSLLGLVGHWCEQSELVHITTCARGVSGVGGVLKSLLHMQR